MWWSCRESVYTWLIKIRSASGQLSPIRHLHLRLQLSSSPSTHDNIPLIFIMLEAFEILTTSGVVLWSKSYAPVGAHVINSLINDVFIEEKVVPQNAAGVSPVFKKEKYTLKWRRNKEFSLIFVVSHKSIHSAPILLQPAPPSAHRVIASQLTSPLGCLPITPPPWLDRQTSGEYFHHLHRYLQGPVERQPHQNHHLPLRPVLRAASARA